MNTEIPVENDAVADVVRHRDFIFQQLFRQLLKLVNKGSGRERRKGWRRLPELVGEFPSCRERQNPGLAIPPG